MSPPFIKRQIIKIGTRGSALALAQAHIIKDLLKKAGGLSDDTFEIIPIVTSGDMLLEKKLQDFGGKGLFTKEIEQSLIDEKIDIAVHSAKDVPTYRQPHLELVACPPRENPQEAFISEKFQSFSSLPIGAIIGTASLRRTAQILHQRPDIIIKLLRGNIQTRLQKIKDGLYDATFLACAGLARLDLLSEAKEIMDEKQFLPAPAQGAIILEIKETISPEIRQLIARINCDNTMCCVIAERAYLQALDGNCRMPIAALARINHDNKLILHGELLSENGTKKVKYSRIDIPENAFKLGLELGRLIKEEFNK